MLLKVCAAAPGCAGFDWRGTLLNRTHGDCRARFPVTPAKAPPAGYTVDSTGSCANITGGTGSIGTACYSRLAPPAPFTCPLPPPPSGLVVVLAGHLAATQDSWSQAGCSFNFCCWLLIMVVFVLSTLLASSPFFLFFTSSRLLSCSQPVGRLWSSSLGPQLGARATGWPRTTETSQPAPPQPLTAASPACPEGELLTQPRT